MLVEITVDQVQMKRECSLAVANLNSAGLKKAAAALQLLDPAERPAPPDMGEARIRLLKHVRQARSPEHIKRLYSALQTAAIVV